jgi:hypothetical protein
MDVISSIAIKNNGQQLFSPGFLEILRFCSHVKNPSLHDVRALTALYRCIRRTLDGREKRYAAKILGLMRFAASSV